MRCSCHVGNSTRATDSGQRKQPHAHLKLSPQAAPRPYREIPHVNRQESIMKRLTAGELTYTRRARPAFPCRGPAILLCLGGRASPWRRRCARTRCFSRQRALIGRRPADRIYQHRDPCTLIGRCKTGILRTSRSHLFCWPRGYSRRDTYRRNTLRHPGRRWARHPCAFPQPSLGASQVTALCAAKGAPSAGPTTCGSGPRPMYLG